MSEDRATEILKSAILLEKRGQAFYAKVAEQASEDAVKRFFNLMAEEEGSHVRVLSDKFKSYMKHQKFDSGDYSERPGFESASRVLTADLKAQISAADFEAAAIAAAMAMEKNAIQVYSRRAAEAGDANEKAFYDWLAKWEAQHLDFLARLDKELTEEIWFDNQFWPF
jgi:rubrerythrin